MTDQIRVLHPTPHRRLAPKRLLQRVEGIDDLVVLLPLVLPVVQKHPPLALLQEVARVQSRAAESASQVM